MQNCELKRKKTEIMIIKIKSISVDNEKYMYELGRCFHFT